MLGELPEARTLIEEARSAGVDDPYIDYIDGLILLRAGEPERAIAALKAAAAAGYSLKLMAAEPHLAGLRDNPDFQAIIGR